MSRPLLVAMAANLLTVLLGTSGIRAQQEDDLVAIAPPPARVPYAIAYAAARVGLDPWDLHGALISTGQGADEYLAAAGLGPPNQPAAVPVPTPRAVSLHRVRLTWYGLVGRTASGAYTTAGGTACSTNWSFGTRFRFSNGTTVVCNDRGILGNTGWLDVWQGRALAALYGPYATVEVLP